MKKKLHLSALFKSKLRKIKHNMEQLLDLKLTKIKLLYFNYINKSTHVIIDMQNPIHYFPIDN